MRPEAQGYAFTESLARLTERHGKAIIVGSVVIAVLAVFGTRRLEVENSFVSYFHKDTEIHQGLELIDQKLGGTTPLDILLKFPPEQANAAAGQAGSGDLAAMFDEVTNAEQASSSWFSDAKIARLKAVHAFLEKQPELGKILSLDSTLRVAEAMNDGQPLGAEGIETIYRQMPDAAKANLLSPFVSVYDNAPVSSHDAMRAAFSTAAESRNSVTTQCDGTFPWAWQAEAISSFARTTKG